MMNYDSYGKTKKQVCAENKSFAYYSGFNGLEFKHIEYGVDDYIYCISGSWGGKKGYHKLKIYNDSNGESYIKLHGGEVKEIPMTKELFEKFADHEIKHFYLDKDADGKPYISIKMEN